MGLPEQWLMHDGSGTTFADATPNANTITASNITWGTGTGITSPAFNGSTSTAVAAQTAITNFDGTKPFSVSVWINTPNSLPTMTFVSTLVTASNYQGWEFGTDPLGRPLLYLIGNFPSDYININGQVAIVPNASTNLIITYDGSQHAAGVTFYTNGEADPVTITTDTLTTSTASGIPIQVGSRADGTDPYVGSMSNLQIFSGVLSSGQIAAIQTAGP